MRAVTALAGAALTACALAVPSPAVADSGGQRIVASAFVEPGFSFEGRLGYRTLLFALYADGRVLAAGEPDTHGVGTYAIGRLDDRASHRLRLALVRATKDVDFGDVPVADVGYTRIRVITGAQTVRARINALGMDLGLSPDQRQARELLLGVIQRAQSAATTAFEPDSYEVRQLPSDMPATQVEWPGPTLPTATCGTVTAAAYAQFPAGFSQGASYTGGGRTFMLWARPLLPGERACRVTSP